MYSGPAKHNYYKWNTITETYLKNATKYATVVTTVCVGGEKIPF